MNIILIIILLLSLSLVIFTYIRMNKEIDNMMKQRKLLEESVAMMKSRNELTTELIEVAEEVLANSNTLIRLNKDLDSSVKDSKTTKKTVIL